MFYITVLYRILGLLDRENVRQMVKKVQDYNEWLIKQPGYTTNFLNIDDGLAISIKENDYERITCHTQVIKPYGNTY